jgi:hypothetical protein
MSDLHGPARVVYRYFEAEQWQEGAMHGDRVWIDGPWVHVFENADGDPDQSFPAHAITAVEWTERSKDRPW